MRRLAVALLVAPYVIWYWPQWVARDFVVAFRDGYRKGMRKP